MDALLIDAELQKLIPPLADEERRQLEENILKDGCRDPLVVWNGTIIDGHNRYEICTRNKVKFKTIAQEFSNRTDVKIWIIKNQFGRRNLAPYTIGELTLKLEPLFAAKAKENQKQSEGRGKKGLQKSVDLKPVDTQKELAKATGGRLSHDTIAKVKLIDKHADEETKNKLRTNQVSIHRVAKDIKETKQKEERKEQRKEAASKVEPQFFDNIHVGDFRDHADKMADGSVSLIFTDPPYDREAIKLLPDLAKFAEAKLCEGGSMLCYVGHIQPPDAFKAFSEHLRYWWTVCCLHSGGNFRTCNGDQIDDECRPDTKRNSVNSQNQEWQLCRALHRVDRRYRAKSSSSLARCARRCRGRMVRNRTRGLVVRRSRS